MDFKQLYNNLNRRAIDALLAMWAGGNKEFQDYLRFIFENDEPLLAEPVFQATFPWENADTTIGELSSVFNPGFIEALDKAENSYRFPKNQSPYKHQLESWRKLLIDKKSIVVTSGTGSGKTECFMLPVLNDLYLQALEGNNEGVGALFLYPLNALMGSQRKRMLAWTKALGNQLRFAVYNGKTVENATKISRDKAFPEIIDRTTIREHPPQILFTNPTMLEYMLVRKSDQSILEKSQGKLRWILLDEAHTFSGSSAAEIAMLIRRVINSFGVSIDTVRFAATSATIGGQQDADATTKGLQQFLAALTGKKVQDIAIIDGKRIVPPLPQPHIHAINYSEIKNLTHEERLACHEVHNFRESFNKQSVLSLTEIGDAFKCKTESERLELVQLLSDNSKTSLIPLRGHYFIRTVPGVFGCTNPECSKHVHARKHKNIPSLTTRLSSTCSECGFPLLEIISCSSCGIQVMTGEVNRDDSIRIRGYDREDSFELEELDTDDEIDSDGMGSHDWNQFWIVNSEAIPHDKRANLFGCGFDKNTGRLNNGPYLMRGDGDDACPLCGDKLKFAQQYKAGTSFLSRLLMPSILEQAPPADPIEHQMVWEGRKVLAFTDSRQGTARSAALMNTEVERSWVRTRVFHALAKERLTMVPQSGGLTDVELKKLEHYKKEPVLFAEYIAAFEQKALAASNPDLVKSPRFSWREMESKLIGRASLQLLNASFTSRNGRGPTDDVDYARALLLDQFARRPRRVNSLETLGLVRIVYPDIEKAEVTPIPRNAGFSNDEWRALLKIALDFVIRENAFILIEKRVQQLVMQHFWTDKIFSTDYDRVIGQSGRRPKKWPVFSRHTVRCPRLALLLCAALGWHDRALIDQHKEDIINQLLQAIWRALGQLGLLEGSDDEGYSLDLVRKSSFELITEAVVCPATYRFMDVTLRGYTPWIKGEVTPENIQRFKIKSSPITMPFFPFPEKIDANGNSVKQEDVISWLSQKMGALKDIGIWSDIYERIYLDYPVFLSGEHSAQQADSRLRSLESKFENGRLNLLSCSTTMEMGVDIGGISIVLMNNVPPKPANYLQRAGRAGRRSESRSLSITFCPANPIGEEVLQNPKWAMTHSVEIPRVQLTSKTIMQRHINSSLFGLFVRSGGGMKVKENVEQFFCSIDGSVESNYCKFIAWLACNQPALDQTLNNLKVDTALHSISNTALIAATQESIEHINYNVNDRIVSCQNEIARLIKDEQCNEDSPCVRSINYELLRLKNENLLKFLVEQGFLPGAGIPVGVLEFNNLHLEDIYEKTRNNSTGHIDNNEDNSFKHDDVPSNNLTRALTEYAPGRSVVLDGWVYKSAGILLQTTFNLGNIIKVRACRHCGHQQMISGDFSANCPVCGNQKFQAIHEIGNGYSEVIEPAGFSVDIFSSPNRKVDNSVQLHRLEPLLLNMEPWQNSSFPAYDIRTGKEQSQILYFSTGEGNGYAVCTECGRTELMPVDGSNPIQNHLRLRGGKERNSNTKYCGGNDNEIKIRQNIVLGGRIATDICEIRVKNTDGLYSNSDALLLSLAVALKWEFCRKLGINDDEIEFGIKNHRLDNNKFKSIFIYDTARGGAGYSQQIPEYFDSLLIDIGKRMKSCNCDSSCSQCLIDRSSQWYMEQLNRHVLIEWIDFFQSFSENLPEQLTNTGQNIKVEYRSLTQAFFSTLANVPIKEVRFFVDGSLNDWDIEGWPLVNELRRRYATNDLKVRLICPQVTLGEKPSNDFVTISRILGWASLETITKPITLNDIGEPLIQIVNYDNNISTWFSIKHQQLPLPNQHWNERLPDKIFFGNIGQLDLATSLIDIQKIKPGDTMAELHYKPEALLMMQFGKFVLNKWINKSCELDKIIPGNEISIIYNDSYLRGPLGCMLLLELLRGLSSELSVKIQSIELLLGRIDESSSIFDNRVYRNWPTNKARRSFLYEAFKSFLKVPNVTIKEVEYDKMVHYRYLSLQTPAHTVTVRPDGGIENGWAVLSSWNFPFREDVMTQLKDYAAKRKLNKIGPSKDVDLLTYVVVDK